MSSVECCICIEVLYGDGGICSCGFHHYHYECFFNWHFICLRKRIEDAMCVICKNPLKKLDQNIIDRLFQSFELNLQQKIVRDDVSDFHFLASLKGVVFYKDLIEACIHFKSLECLKTLKVMEYSTIFHRVVSDQLMAEFFAERNFIKTCWILDDFTLNPHLYWTNSDLIDRLIISGKYYPLLLLIRNHNEHLSFEEQYRIVDFFYSCFFTGIQLRRESCSHPLQFFSIITGSDTEIGCYYIRKIFSHLARKYYKEFSVEDINTFTFYLKKRCRHCLDAHFWEVISLAIMTDDLDFFEFLWNLPNVNQRLSISLQRLLNMIIKSRNSCFFFNFLEKNEIIEQKTVFKRIKWWKIGCYSFKQYDE